MTRAAATLARWAAQAPLKAGAARIDGADLRKRGVQAPPTGG
ncbi:hypothetical protein [Massilia glaciei]|nr:hypothetical protein [Massilia glaciei]